MMVSKKVFIDFWYRFDSCWQHCSMGMDIKNKGEIMILDLHEILKDDEEAPTLGVVLLSLLLIVFTIVLVSIILYLGRIAFMIFA